MIEVYKRLGFEMLEYLIEDDSEYGKTRTL